MKSIGCKAATFWGGPLHTLLLVGLLLGGCSSVSHTAAKPSVAPDAHLADTHEEGKPNLVSPPTPHAVRPAQYLEQAPAAIAPPSIPAAPDEMPHAADPAAASEHPVDLPSALRLAGANNLQIALAIERVTEAHAAYGGAKALWLPSLRGGVGYNRHTGRIQDTRGDVIEVRRSSVFTGGGAGIASSPLNGASGGPARLFVDLSLTDAYFEPLAACQVVRATAAGRDAVFNDVLFRVAVAYLDLVAAQGRLGIAREAVSNADDLLGQTQAHVKAGFVQPADVQRVRAELAFQQRAALAAEERIGVTSAELARLLRLDPAVKLYSPEAQVVPVEMVPIELASGSPLPGLIAQAHGSRPEVAAAAAAVCETCLRVNQEQWRPWVPHLYVGFSGGGFGGGPNEFIGNYSDRTDFDAVAAWELQNLGLGNRALRRGAASRHRQAHIAESQVRDAIAAEVTSAYHQVVSRGRQLDHARQRERAAELTLSQSLTTFKLNPGAVRPIEAQTAVRTLSSARGETLNAIIGYSQAQFALLRALGKPPAPQSCAQ